MKQYGLGLYEKAMPGDLTWREKLTATAEAGFDFLELSIDESDARLARLNMSASELRALRVAMTETGLPIRTICLSGHRRFPLGSHDPSVRARGLEIMEQAIALAAALGVRVIQLAGYDVYYEGSDAETVAAFESGLRKAVEMASAAGVSLGFETMETPFMDTVQKAMTYVQLLDSPYLGVYPDIGNLTNAAATYGHSLSADLGCGRGHIWAAHLKETKPHIFREVPFGTGHTNFTGCVRALHQMGVRLFTGEFWYVGSPCWKQDITDACAFLRSAIDSALIGAASLV